MGITIELGLFAALLGLGAALLPFVIRFMQEHRLTVSNYDGVQIPSGLGLLIWLLHMVYLGMLLLIESLRVDRQVYEFQAKAATYIVAVSIVFVAGWLDDTIGDRTVKGWKGHWRKWRQEKVITTGWLKAGGTGGAALIAVVSGGALPGVGVIVLQVGLLILMTNALNLLDLRPGRCLKTFLAASIAVLPFGQSGERHILLLPALAGAAALLPGDLRAKHMLGDAGANVLGFAVGYAVIGGTPLWVQTGLAGLLLALHWYAEKRSISVWIDEHRFMRWLDRWGRA